MRIADFGGGAGGLCGSRGGVGGGGGQRRAYVSVCLYFFVFVCLCCCVRLNAAAKGQSPMDYARVAGQEQALQIMIDKP